MENDKADLHLSYPFYSLFFTFCGLFFYNQLGKNIGLALMSLMCFYSIYKLGNMRKFVQNKALKKYLKLSGLCFGLMIFILIIQGSTLTQYKAFFKDYYNFIFVVLLSLCVSRIPITRLPKKFLIYFLSFTTILTLFICCYEFLLGQNPLNQMLGKNLDRLYFRAEGLHKNPIPFSHLAGYFFIILIFLLPTIEFTKRKYKGLYFVSSFSLLVSCLLSQTRATILGLSLIFLFSSFFYFKKWRYQILGLMSLTLIICAISPKLKRAVRITSTNNFSIAYRLHTWKAHLRATADHPILGVGYNNFFKKKVMLKYHHDTPEVVREKNNFSKDWDSALYGATHNHYLRVLTTFGIPFFIFYLCFLFYPLWVFLNQFRSSDSQVHKNLLICFSVSIVFIYFVIFFDKFSSVLFLLYSFSIALGFRFTQKKSSFSIKI